MAASSSNPSFIVEVGEESYPYSSHVNAPSAVTVKLTGNDKYKVWKTQMLCLLISHNMVGFIKGKFLNPEGNVKKKAGDMEAWVRSDALVKSWIYGTISQEAAMNVVDHLSSKLHTADFTAKDVWDELQRIYDPQIILKAAEITSSMSDVDRNSLKILMGRLERGRNRSTQNPPTICVVPSSLRDLSPRSFNPLVVSIGPLHKDEEKTKEFEVVKDHYLHDLLHRTNSPPEQVLKECVEKVKASMDKIRASYAVIIPFSDIDLANMMVIDACFILEFCLKHYDHHFKYLDKILNETLRVDVAYDLILLENQIPFFVLQDMFDCTCGRRDSTLPLNKLVYVILKGYVDPFRYVVYDKEFPNRDAVNESTHDHVLGYFHTYYKPVSCTPLKPTAGTETTTPKEVAMQIKSFLSACFSWCRGKPTNLLVPTLHIYEETEKILRNFIAYEETFPKLHNYFTSYATALSDIVKDEEDVATLVELNVLVNHLGPHKEAANMLQAIRKQCFIKKFSSHQDLMQLKNYYNSSWLRNIRRLRSTYFSSPWSAIALVAGIILFSLTIVQTVFTIRGPL
ncbi:UPF0481 protein At3g47200-like isoform X1 [Rutidosis leptorrhynchoides]|uniref:UPF0481 protein At3g47200-like isoform X1 n=1 Tax=Rutidosis leptorrhynchoides TaxID=125765 RepID=UPI003A996D53